MRFLIDVTDLRRQTHDKYDRIVRKLANEAGAGDGLAVEILDGGKSFWRGRMATGPRPATGGASLGSPQRIFPCCDERSS